MDFVKPFHLFILLIVILTLGVVALSMFRKSNNPWLGEFPTFALVLGGVIILTFDACLVIAFFQMIMGN